MSPIHLTSYPGLDERIIVIRAGDLVDAVFVRTRRFNVLIDTLDTPASCRSAIDKIGPGVRDKPLIVVNSHMDWDHFWGNAAIAERAPIVAHERALQRFWSPTIQEKLSSKTKQDQSLVGLTLCPPTVTFSDRLRLEGGDLTLELFPTPGHTPDHIAAWIPELRVCFAIDAVERPIPKVWSDDPDDLSALIASLRAIQSLGAEHVVLAHGQTSSPAVVDANLAYFAALAERVEASTASLNPAETSSLPKSLDLWDLVPLPATFSSESRAFYEAFHLSNLRATIKSVGHR